MGGRGGMGLALAAGMIAMASVGVSVPLTAAPRRQRGGTRFDPPMQDRKTKSQSLSTLLRKGRAGGRV